MYTFVNALHYAFGKWESLNPLELTISQLLLNCYSILITVVDDSGKYYLINKEHLNTIGDKSVYLQRYLLVNYPTLPELDSPVDLIKSSYKDVTGVSRIGNDYIVDDLTIPYLISNEGLFKVTNQHVKSIHNVLSKEGDFNLGYLAVDLPSKVTTLKAIDFKSGLFKLPRIVSLSNTLLVFGDSIFKLSNLFSDDGQWYRLKDGWCKWLIDIYMDNISSIPPISIGLPSDSFNKNDLIATNTLVNIFTHHNVFLVEYTNDLPIGEETINVVNEYINEFSNGLIMYNNKPTTNKVLQLATGFIVRGILAKTNLKLYNDNPYIDLTSENYKLTKPPMYIYNLTYPNIALK